MNINELENLRTLANAKCHAYEAGKDVANINGWREVNALAYEAIFAIKTGSHSLAYAQAKANQALKLIDILTTLENNP